MSVEHLYEGVSVQFTRQLTDVKYGKAVPLGDLTIFEWTFFAENESRIKR